LNCRAEPLPGLPGTIDDQEERDLRIARKTHERIGGEQVRTRAGLVLDAARPLPRGKLLPD
jgi:hypothetical protein